MGEQIVVLGVDGVVLDVGPAQTPHGGPVRD